MTRRGSFKRAVRRQARASGKPYTQALADMRGDEIWARVSSSVQGLSSLPARLEQRCGVAVAAVSRLGMHGDRVLRVDLRDGTRWVARVFVPDRPVDQIRGDAEILRFLEDHDFPAERCAAEDPVFTHVGQGVLLTTFVDGTPNGPVTPARMHALAELLGRLHALPPATGAVARPGGAFGHDPLREGRPSEDLAAALSFLDAIADGVAPEGSAAFEGLREQVAAADICEGLPEALLHSGMADRDVITAPDGTLVATDWRGAGRGPRIASLAFLLSAAERTPDGDAELIDAVAHGYSRHVRLETEELDRLAAAMRLRPLYFAAWYYWRTVASGVQPTGDERWWPNPERTDAVAAKAVAALDR